MKFVCDSCGEVDHVLLDAYVIGDRILEGCLFRIEIHNDKMEAHPDNCLDYLKDNHMNIKKLEKEMEEYAYDEYKEDGCGSMQCGLCGESEIITIKE